VAGRDLTVTAGTTISTRNIADIINGDHVGDDSQGNSGNITLHGQNITLNSGSQFYSHATGSHSAGDILLHAEDGLGLIERTDFLGIGTLPTWVQEVAYAVLPVDVSSSDITIDGAAFKGGNMDVIAETGKTEEFRREAKTFDPAGAVDGGSNTVNFDTPHGFTNGTALVYDGGEGETAIGGLENGSTYYAVVVDEWTLQLASDAAGSNIVSLDPLVATGDAHSLAYKDSFFKPLTDRIAKYFGYRISPASVAISSSTISLTGATDIDVTSLDLNATATTEAKINGSLLSSIITPIVVGYSQPSAHIDVGGTTVIATTGDVSLNAAASSTIEASTGFQDFEEETYIEVGQFNLDKKVNDLIRVDEKVVEKIHKALFSWLPEFHLAVGVGIADSSAIIDSGALVNAGGNVTVEAHTTKDQKVEAKAEAKEEGLVVGIAVSVFVGNATAAIDGEVTAGGNVTVQADTISGGNETAAGAKIELKKEAEQKKCEPEKKPTKEESIENLEKSSLDKKGDGSSDKEDSGKPDSKEMPPPENKDLDPNTDANSTKGSGLSNAIKKKNVTGSAALSWHHNQATARIGDDALVAANGGNVSVTATTRDEPKIDSVTEVELKKSYKEQGDKTPTTENVGGSFIISFLNNSAQAYIGQNATVDASRDVIVRSATKVPWSGEQDLIDIDAFMSLGEGETWSSFDYGVVWQPLSTIISGVKFGSFNKEYLSTKGMVNTWARSAGESTGSAANGAFNVQFTLNRSKAFIDTGARVNQGAGSHGNVIVEALNDTTMVNLAGVIPGGALKDFFKPVGSEGTSGGGLGILASGFYNDVTAEIRGNARVYGESVAVIAGNDVKNISIAPVFGEAEGDSLNGSLSLA